MDTSPVRAEISTCKGWEAPKGGALLREPQMIWSGKLGEYGRGSQRKKAGSQIMKPFQVPEEGIQIFFSL